MIRAVQFIKRLLLSKIIRIVPMISISCCFKSLLLNFCKTEFKKSNSKLGAQ